MHFSTQHKYVILDTGANIPQVIAFATHKELAECAIHRTFSEMTDIERAAWLRDLASAIDTEAAAVAQPGTTESGAGVR